MTQTDGKTTLPLPRILCLHGGGVNAEIFEVQCRSIIARLGSSFRLVFMNAPFLSAPHPSIVSVFGDHGPFRRWLRWEPDHPEIDGESATQEIRYQVLKTMEDDPGTGEWVGILGFSQGAKIAASLLWTQQTITEKFGEAEAFTHFKFGVLMAGRGPIVMMDHRAEHNRYVADSGELSSAFSDWPKTNQGSHVLRIPTLHIHGLRDVSLDQHRILREAYCADGTTTLVEWDGGHRIPIKTHDVEAVVEKILELGEAVEVI